MMLKSIVAISSAFVASAALLFGTTAYAAEGSKVDAPRTDLSTSESPENGRAGADAHVSNGSETEPSEAKAPASDVSKADRAIREAGKKLEAAEESRAHLWADKEFDRAERKLDKAIEMEGEAGDKRVRTLATDAEESAESAIDTTEERRTAYQERIHAVLDETRAKIAEAREIGAGEIAPERITQTRSHLAAAEDAYRRGQWAAALDEAETARLRVAEAIGAAARAPSVSPDTAPGTPVERPERDRPRSMKN